MVFTVCKGMMQVFILENVSPLSTQVMKEVRTVLCIVSHCKITMLRLLNAEKILFIHTYVAK